MEIKRPEYLKQLIDYQWDGQVKVITGIRRCGKSYLLNNLFKKHLLETGVPEDHIIMIALDLAKDIRFRNPLVLTEYVHALVDGKTESWYLFVDEIQMSDDVTNPYNHSGKKITFYDALNDLRNISTLDVYVTGSNSKMLSSDILTQFRGRSDEIRLHPLSFSEFYSASTENQDDAFDLYAFYGGMPLVLSKPTEAAKMNYLTSLFSEVYLKDIIERKFVEREDILSNIVDLLCSSIGSLTNPNKIHGLLCTNRSTKVSPNTVSSYIHYLEDAFLFSESKRFDVKGKEYFNYPSKYYCEDIGLRNARIGFRQQELTHIMENIIYNELIIRGFHVDVGVIQSREKNREGQLLRKSREIDFIATKGDKKVYIQSAYALPDEEKTEQENKPLRLTGDAFQKIIVRKDIRKRWTDEAGILNIGLLDFLLDEKII